MTNSIKHINDNPSMCLYCKNFRLIPCEIPGIFKCENKNTPDEVKICDNFVDRQEKEYPSSYEIVFSK